MQEYMHGPVSLFCLVADDTRRWFRSTSIWVMRSTDIGDALAPGVASEELETPD
jgi:hypothetical protein